MTLRCLFVDFNSYFASVEQYDEPRLRDRPVGVVPVMAPTTCCIAASYEAKAHGVKTGTAVWEAVERCPDIMLVEARPARYVQLHHELMAVIGDCIPHGEPLSIDEVPCWLIGRERGRANAEAIARRIKLALVERGYGPAIRCSIGIAPNRFLAKTASDMHKPDGLTVIEQSDLPHALHGLQLRDFCGIGPAMERRLHRAGIDTAERLCSATRRHLRTAWGSIEGERYWLKLRGFELPERPSRRGTIGHSHVLGPELRDFDGARAVLFKLLAKAAMRLRHEGYLAGGLSVRLRFVGRDEGYSRDVAFAPIDDTPSLLRLLAAELEPLERAMRCGRWNPRRHPPLSVAATLVNLEPAGSLTHELMDERRRATAMSTLLDRVNRRYGNNTLYFGSMQEALARDAAPMRIPFSKIPDAGLEEDVPVHGHADRSPRETSEALWLQRERRFKALAEASRREATRRGRRGNGVAGGTDTGAPAVRRVHVAADTPSTLPLF